MKDAIAVSFYTCDFETHKQERIDDPCGKWLWEWIGIEPLIPPEWYIANSTTYTAYQLNYIEFKESEIIAGAEEDFIRCEADRVNVIPELGTGWTLRVTTDLNQIVSSSDYQITDNRKSTQLTVNFGDGTGDGAGCSLLPLELFSVVTDTYFTVFNETSGEWTLTGGASQVDFINYGTYGKTVTVDSSKYHEFNYRNGYNFDLTLPKMGVFGPVFTESIPDAVKNRVTQTEVVYTLAQTSIDDAIYAAVGIEIIHNESNQNIVYSAFDTQEPPNHIDTSSIQDFTVDQSVSIGSSFEFAKSFSIADSLAAFTYDYGTFEVNCFLLAAGFSSRRYNILGDATNAYPDENTYDGMNFTPIFLDNIPTSVGYTPGDYGLLKQTVSFFYPLTLKNNILQFNLTQTINKGWIYNLIEITNPSLFDLFLAFNSPQENIDPTYGDSIPAQWCVNIPAGATVQFYLSVIFAHSTNPFTGLLTKLYNQCSVHLTEKDGTHSLPVNMPEITLDNTYQLKSFARSGTLQNLPTDYQIGDSIFTDAVDEWEMPNPIATIDPTVIVLDVLQFISPNEFPNFFDFECEFFNGTDWIYQAYSLENLAPVYYDILENLGLNLFQFKIRPDDAVIIENSIGNVKDAFCEGVYTIAEVYVSEAEVLNELTIYIETNYSYLRNVDLSKTKFGKQLAVVGAVIPPDQAAVLSPTEFATYLTISL